MRVTTQEVEDQDEEDIENTIYESESDCTIVASSDLSSQDAAFEPITAEGRDSVLAAD
jgi:hypothetical protein